jgi:hypothetical protein
MSIPLPYWSDAHTRVEIDKDKASAVNRFIDSFEPANPEYAAIFRRLLVDALNEAMTLGSQGLSPWDIDMG